MNGCRSWGGWPNCAPAHRELGLVLNFTGFFEESLDELRKCIELDPTCIDARNELALAYTMLGMMDEAKREFESLVKRMARAIEQAIDEDCDLPVPEQQAGPPAPVPEQQAGDYEPRSGE